MATLKYSRQREAIKRCLMRRMDHPTAEMIYADLREEDPKLSLGTVYRNLGLLTQLGEIRKIPTGDGPDHFDGITSRHDHFICKRCQRIMDLHLPDPVLVRKEAQEQTDGRVDEIVLNVYGLCDACVNAVTNEEQEIRI